MNDESVLLERPVPGPVVLSAGLVFGLYVVRLCVTPHAAGCCRWLGVNPCATGLHVLRG